MPFVSPFPNLDKFDNNNNNNIRVPGSGIFKSGKFLLKLRAHHSGKFAPRENNPLYGICLLNTIVFD